MNRLLTIFLLFQLVSGCTGVNPENLKVVNIESSFVLDSYIEHKGKQRLSVTIEGLSSGEYTATFQDNNGVYYKGVGRCVTVKNADGIKILDAEGGLWVPNTNSKKLPRIFAYIHPDNNQIGSIEVKSYDPSTATEKTEPVVGAVAGAIIRQLNSLDFGRVNFGAEIKDPTFINQINIAN